MLTPTVGRSDHATATQMFSMPLSYASDCSCTFAASQEVRPQDPLSPSISRAFDHTLCMTTVLRATDSADFLSIVPALAGFTPRESIVLLPFRGTRTDGAMRLDLPDDETDLEAYADAAVGLVARVTGTDALAAVVYTADEAHGTRDGLVLPHAVAVDEVLGCAEDAGLRVVDALCVTPSGWSSYIEVDHPDSTPSRRSVARQTCRRMPMSPVISPPALCFPPSISPRRNGWPEQLSNSPPRSTGRDAED